MARNKYPEETVEKILDVSLRLFLEKGYEHTSIQDIIDGLGGLTKGAIYHHFRSKDEILLALTDRLTAASEQRLRGVRDDPTLNGREKLRNMFLLSLQDSGQGEIFSFSPNLIRAPHFLAVLVQNVFEEVAPLYVEPILRQGIADGSIQVDSPHELAEVLMLLGNLWLNPLVTGGDAESIRQRFLFYGDLLRRYGLDFMDDIMRDSIEFFSRAYLNTQNHQQSPKE